jgi:hypothetical protein
MGGNDTVASASYRLFVVSTERDKVESAITIVDCDL